MSIINERKERARSMTSRIKGNERIMQTFFFHSSIRPDG